MRNETWAPCAVDKKLMGLFKQIYFQDRWNHVLQEISKT